MSDHKSEFFGGPVFAQVQRNASVLWPLLKDDPRFSFHGRAVGLANPTEQTVELITSLVKLTGLALCDYIPADDFAPLQAALNSAGFYTDHMDIWQSGASTVDIARQFSQSSTHPPPAQITWIDPDTPGSEMQKLDDFTQAHGTSLPCGTFIRGHGRPAVCAYASDESGKIYASAAAAAHFHEAHARSDIAYWGMLATRADMRGKGAALGLGARAIVAMSDRFGFGRYFTPIKRGNSASEHLCAKLGFTRQNALGIMTIDRALLGQ